MGLAQGGKPGFRFVSRFQADMKEMFEEVFYV